MHGIQLIGLLSSVALSFATTATAQIASGSPSIASYHALGRCMDVRASDNAVLLWNCHGGANQAFRFVSGSYGMISLGNQRCLTAGTARGALSAQVCTNAVNQRWGFQANGTLRSENGFCADIQGGATNSGAPVLGWDCSGSSNQRWYPAVTARSAFVGIAATAELGNRSGRAYVGSANFSASNVVASGGGNIVAGGAGNLIANDGASIVAGGAGNIIGTNSGAIVAAGAGNIVAGGAGNITPANWSFFSGNGAGMFRQ
jgi:hypothetical protein